MRIVQRVFLYLISIAMIAAGAAVAALPFNQQMGEYAATLPERWMACLLIGCTAAALGIVTLLPFDLFRRKGRGISFAGPTGTVSIQIDPFEVSLRKTIAKLPMVKRVSVEVTPKDNNRKVGIVAAVSLKKPADSSTRETAERLREFIEKVSRQILGADEVMTVDVSIQDVLIDPTQTAESLNGIFAAAEKTVAPVERTVTPAAAAVPVAAGTLAAASTAYEGEDAEADEDEYAAAPAQPDPEAGVTHSSDLLTYEEAQELEHARASSVDTAHDVAPVGDDTPGETSFQSLAVETGETQDDEPKPNTIASP
ncbi:MAG: hypothetical protein HUU46_14235 [Candidatus Hydrogenedentes bacterium]|nr:hypothetical protein [Candidatus Hydrogenedentota bacterium]